MTARAISEIGSLKDLSPADATAKLAEMTAAFRQQAATPAADSLAGMLKNPAFLEGLRQGGGNSDGVALPGGAAHEQFMGAVAEARAEAGDPVSLAIAGHTDDINDGDYLRLKQGADMLRDMGVREDVIRQVLAGEPVSRAEHERVKQWKSDIMVSTQEEAVKFRAAYLKGDPVAVRTMLNANIVLGSPLKEEAAA